METARYIITLWKSDAPNARVSRTIRRADDDRAVSYARDWLFASRRSTGIIFLYYDRWTVQAAGSNELPRIVATGEDQDNGAPPTPWRKKTAKSKKEKEAAEWRARNVPIPRDKALPVNGFKAPKYTPDELAKRGPNGRKPSALRDRLMALKAEAKQRIADEANNGRKERPMVETSTGPEESATQSTPWEAN